MPLRVSLTRLLLLVAVSAMAQAPEGGRPSGEAVRSGFEGRADVIVGNVDVAVIGADGHPVTGLVVEDFALLVDEVETAISHFAAAGAGDGGGIPTRSGEEPVADLPVPSVAPQVVVIYVDNANTLVFDRNAMLRRLAAWVRATMQPPTRVIVAVFDTHLRFVTPLSPEPELIAGALEGLMQDSRNVGTNQNTLRTALTQILSARDDSMAGDLPGAPTRPHLTQSMWSMIRLTSQEIADETHRSLDALRLLVRSLSGVEGRKSVVYVSGGLPSVPGLELRMAMAGDTIGPQQFAPDDDFVDLVKWASAAEVSFYTVDARGLLPGGGGAESRYRMPHGAEATYLHNYQDAVASVAERTGGIAIVGTNQLAEGLDRIHAAMSQHYSLGFPLALSGEDRVHSIRVGVRDRPGVRLRYRQTLVERSPATRVADGTIAALAFGLSQNQLGIRVRTGTAEPLPEKGRFGVPVVVMVPASRLLLTREGDTLRGSVRVFAIASGSEGRRTPLAKDHFTIEVPVERAGGLGTLGLETRLEIEEGTWKLSVGVLDDRGLATGHTLLDVVTPEWRR